jgi:cytidylate kinase
MANFIVTVDGPAGAGKSTVAKLLAKKLGVAFLDTGAMYRALTVKALRRKMDLDDEAALVQLAHDTKIDLVNELGKPLKVLLDGEDVSEAIRSVDVTNNTFYVARTAGVRHVMVEWQRALGRKQPMVGDGRDLGTVVYPEAQYKFYLDADFHVRCQRRIDELKAKGQAVDEEALRKDLADRDQKDITRKVGPLKKADDGIVIDSTGMSIDEVVETMARHIRKNTP